MATIDRHGSTLTVVEFDQIADLTFDRDESFLTDSQITLELKDGRPISFPVSSEVNRDEKFFEAIQKRVDEKGESADSSSWSRTRNSKSEARNPKQIRNSKLK